MAPFYGSRLLHFASVVDDAKCIVVTRFCLCVYVCVCVSVCLSVCPRPYVLFMALLEAPIYASWIQFKIMHFVFALVPIEHRQLPVYLY